MTDALATSFARLHGVVQGIPPVMIDGARRFVLFFSFSDGKNRATVLTARADSAEEAWRIGIAGIIASGARVRWLRLDWIDAVERRTWKELRSELGKIKRNYFRLGISLDAGFEQAFLETELNANAMLYGGPREATAVLNEKNFRLYAARRHRLENIAFADDDPIWLFTTGGAFIGDDGRVHSLCGNGLDAGRRMIERLDADGLLEIIGSGSRYLASQVRADGRFDYGWHPCFDRPIDAYNSLRHASSLYSMIEAWEVTRDDALRSAIEPSLVYLTEELIRTVHLPRGGEAAFLIDTGSEIKLGGNAVAILALVKYTELTGDERYLGLLERLAAGILHMQDPATGRFRHVLNFPALDVKQDFRIIYYDGEAAFGLMRLHALTGDRRWLSAVEKAFSHFIRAEHWKAHDHWLSYCVNELTLHRPEERYYRFGLDNFKDHLDFVLERITTFPTLLELMTAAEKMVERLRRDPALKRLLNGIDLNRFYKALHFRARYLLNGHFWPELAMYYANPEKILGSFFIRHHAFRIRIDDVEHYLSGLIAYRTYLLERGAGGHPEGDAPLTTKGPRHWTASEVERATGGHWAVAPPPDWTAAGLCMFAPAMQPGDMVCLRPKDGKRGVSINGLARLRHAPAALIVACREKVPDAGCPVLVVEDTDATILALGRYARDRIDGKIVGITGSAGKTTAVAMLAHVLEPFGGAGQTRSNANLPHGIAWNLASIPWDTPHVVLELAIGRMKANARLARPDVAIFTNILPAHLEFHRDLATIAARKSAIFLGMAPEGTAVLNRDMAEWDGVRMAARSLGLKIVSYGRHPDCDFQLLRYEPAAGEVTARADARELRYRLSAHGEHMALNSLAVLAGVSALGHELEPAIARLSDFVSLAGRGEELGLTLGRRHFMIIDDAYNANPGSMEAALARLGSHRGPGRRTAVLGEMLELGEGAGGYHQALVPLIDQYGIEKVYVLGDLYDAFWNDLPEKNRGMHAYSLENLKSALIRDIRDNDIILFKGSHGSGIYKLVDHLKAEAAGPVPAECMVA